MDLDIIPEVTPEPGGGSLPENPKFQIRNVGEGTIVRTELLVTQGNWKDRYVTEELIPKNSSIRYLMYQRESWHKELWEEGDVQMLLKARDPRGHKFVYRRRFFLGEDGRIVGERL